jgi:uncharacterized membrane protein
MRDVNHKNVFFLFILSVVNLVVYFVFRSKSYFDFLQWNLFLAWIPLVLSNLVRKSISIE